MKKSRRNPKPFISSPSWEQPAEGWLRGETGRGEWHTWGQVCRESKKPAGRRFCLHLPLPTSPPQEILRIMGAPCPAPAPSGGLGSPDPSQQVPGDRSHPTLSTPGGGHTPARAPHCLLPLLNPGSPGSPAPSVSPIPGPAGSSPQHSPGMRGRAEGPRPLRGPRGRRSCCRTGLGVSPAGSCGGAGTGGTHPGGGNRRGGGDARGLREGEGRAGMSAALSWGTGLRSRGCVSARGRGCGAGPRGCAHRSTRSCRTWGTWMPWRESGAEPSRAVLCRAVL